MVKKMGVRILQALPAWIILIVLIGNPGPITADSGVFSTWEGFEVDKCASIWLIQKYIDNNAEIKFYPKGERIKEGIAFDTPEAKFRRYFNRSTYETLLEHYELTDPKLIYIGKIIHDIEVNVWERKVMDETIVVQEAVLKIINEAADNKKIIAKSRDYFNFLYESVPEE